MTEQCLFGRLARCILSQILAPQMMGLANLASMSFTMLVRSMQSPKPCCFYLYAFMSVRCMMIDDRFSPDRRGEL